MQSRAGTVSIAINHAHALLDALARWDTLASLLATDWDGWEGYGKSKTLKPSIAEEHIATLAR